MDHRTTLLGMNTMRAIEANARIGKVLLHDLRKLIPEFEQELGGEINIHALSRATEALIDAADAVHDRANKLVKDSEFEVPADDAEGVILVQQCCGGK